MSILADVTLADNQVYPVMVVDISASGARILTDAEAPSGLCLMEFGVHGKEYRTRFEVARVLDIAHQNYWGVRFLDLSAEQIAELRNSVAVFAGDATYSLFEWEHIKQDASRADTVHIGFSAIGAEISVPSEFALQVGVDGLKLMMDAYESTRIMPA